MDRGVQSGLERPVALCVIFSFPNLKQVTVVRNAQTRILLPDSSTAIQDDELPLLNKSHSLQWGRYDLDSPRFPGQIKAYFEGFHRLHCVTSASSTGNAKVLRHVEHCIDNMRWGIHCNADVTPYLFERWIAPDEKPRPRLNLRKPAKCRNIEDMYEYAQKNTIEGLKPLI
ncbi:hypothetical protein MMC25_003234 [Agyrium rufum]|nr:hypothetical protein [Agyrium rufum]